MPDASAPKEPSTLHALRAQIDVIDDAIHDLLMKRAALVGDIQDHKQGAQSAIIQPKREAEILQRLAARHHGVLPFASVGRIWREILGTFAYLQRNFAVALWHSAERPGVWDRARDHFGTAVTLIPHGTPGQVIRDVTERTATLGVLPFPSNDMPDHWWRLLMTRGPDSPRVIGRLPLFPGGNAREAGDLLIIARPSTAAIGDDRVILALEFTNEVSRAKLVSGLDASGFSGQILALSQTGDRDCAALAEVAGPVPAGDPRLTELAAQIGRTTDSVHHLGGYASPISDAVPAAKP